MPKPIRNAFEQYLTPSQPGQELANARQLPIELVDLNPHQARQRFDETALDELRQSIQQHGVLEPLLVRPRGERYQIIAGERRYRAAINAGLSYVPVLIHPDVDDTDAAILTTLENLQREDLDPEDEARQFARLLELTGISGRKLAELLGVDHTYLARRVKMLQEQPALFAAVRAGDLTWRDALVLLHGATPALFAAVQQGALTWREARNRLAHGVPLASDTATVLHGATPAAATDDLLHGATLPASDAALLHGATAPLLINGQVTPRAEDPPPRAAMPASDPGRWRNITSAYRTLGKIQPATLPLDECRDLIAQLQDLETQAATTRRALLQRIEAGA